MRGYWAIPVLLSILLLAGMNPAFAVVFNTGFDGDVSSDKIPKNGLFPFVVFEGRQGNIDLNGDGDATDFVLHLFNTNTEIVSNQMLAGFGGTISDDGNLLAFCVNEVNQGNIDLNGDSDTFDCVLHVKDLSTGIVTNVGISGSPISFEGNTIVFRVGELFGENKDLNGDGDVGDFVLHLYDVNTKTITNTGLVVGFFIRDGNFIVLSVDESQQNQDLNFDGDLGDRILHFYNIGTSTATNLEQFAVDFNFDGSIIAFNLLEVIEGVDLNGDGDTSFDRVLHTYDVNTGITTNLGLASTFPFVDGNIIAFAVSEGEQGSTDFNGDGDSGDAVYHIFDTGTGTLTNLALGDESGDMILEGNILAFIVNEFIQGNTDLNEDGDTNDVVLHVYNIATGVTTNLGFVPSSIFDVDISGNLVAFTADENGSVDLNGDGDNFDFVPHAFDVSTGIIKNTGIASNSLVQTDGSILFFTVDEGIDGVDLNGDGDAFDQDVAHVFDFATSTTTNLMIMSDPPEALGSGVVMFEVGEEDQGNTDLNGDGDTNDVVLHMFKLDVDTDGITIDNFDVGDVQIPLGPAFEFVQVDQTGLTGVIGGARTIGVGHNSGTGSLFTINTSPTLGQLSFSADSGTQVSGNIIYNANNAGLNIDLSNEDGIRLTINDLTTPVNLEITLNDNSFITSTGFTQSIFPTGSPFTVDALFSDFSTDPPFDFSDVGGIEFSMGINDANSGIVIESIETFNLGNDSDGDGIADSIDVDPNNPSNDFSDGTTFGTITSGNANLSITDDPSNGVNITATGDAIISACGIVTISFTAGDSINLTCGSATIEVIEGEVEITELDGQVTILGEGETTTFEGTAEEQKKSCKALNKENKAEQKGKAQGKDIAKENNECN